MQSKIRESVWCEIHAQREISRRGKEASKALGHGSNLVAAMLAEGKLIDEVLEPLKLTHQEKIDYVAKNSELIKSSDGHEAIQIVWANAQAICIHRLLSKEFRHEFQAFWLGVWCETISDIPRKQLISTMAEKVKYREESRKQIGVNGELCFAAIPAVVHTLYEFRA